MITTTTKYVQKMDKIERKIVKSFFSNFIIWGKTYTIFFLSTVAFTSHRKTSD